LKRYNSNFFGQTQVACLRNQRSKDFLPNFLVCADTLHVIITGKAVKFNKYGPSTTENFALIRLSQYSKLL
jgi:hypothetical protein